MLVLLFLFIRTAFPQQPARSPAEAMQDSIAKQRESVRKQLQTAVPQNPAPSAWFSTPWQASTLPPITAPAPIDTTLPAPPQVSSFAPPPCDPIPPDKISTLITEASTRERVKEELLRAVIQKESAFRPCAVSPKGAQGLMQLMPATARELGVEDPFDPKQNIDAGARFLGQLLNKYGGNVELALSAYNAGQGAVDKAGGVPDITETKKYLVSILQNLYY